MSKVYATTNTPMVAPGRSLRTWSDSPNPPYTSGSSSWRNTAINGQSPYRYTCEYPEWQSEMLKGKDVSTAFRARYTRYFTPCIYTQAFEGTSASTPPHFSISQSWTWMAREIFPYIDDRVEDLATKDLALARLKRKVGNNVKQMQTIAPVAELKDLQSTIKHIAYWGVDLVKALIDIKRTKGKSAVKYASDCWLQWSFAVAPTIGDAVALAEVIHELLNTPDKTSKYTERGVARKEWFSTGGNFVQAEGNALNRNCRLNMHHTLSYRYVAGFSPQIASGNNYNAMRMIGMENPLALLPAAWELTAFSWLFDYFSTMGDYLEDTFVASAVDSIYVTCTRKYSCWGEYDMGFPFANGVWKSKFVISPVVEKPAVQHVFVERTPLTSIPSRSLRLKTSDEIARNSVNKVLNLASVLVGGKSFHNGPDLSGSRRVWAPKF